MSHWAQQQALARRSSDQAGRKPVLAAALGASALSTIVFILAPNVGLLLAGRILSGLSAGLIPAGDRRARRADPGPGLGSLIGGCSP